MSTRDEEHVDTDGENPNNTAEICGALAGQAAMTGLWSPGRELRT